ncbi:MAG: hypothetical protein HY554_01215 [Elusimicrobia bacterium]|nr:hypothetical protein [Elusimicrobiota bacterium]
MGLAPALALLAAFQAPACALTRIAPPAVLSGGLPAASVMPASAFDSRSGLAPSLAASAIAPAALSLPQAPPPGLATPAAADLLQRAEDGPGLPAVGRAIQGAKTLREVAARLEAQGVLRPGEVDTGSDAALYRFADALAEVWYQAAPRTPRAFELDRSWAIPAQVVRSGDATYLVHGLFPHPAGLSLVPAQRTAVLRLVEQVKARGGALYSEQNLPLAYGYRHGLEVVDMDERERAPLPRALVRPAHAPLRLPVGAGVKAWWTALTIAAPAAWAAAAPQGLWPWAALAASAAYNVLFWKSWVPLRGLRLQLKALRAAAGGRPERALSLFRKARAIFTSRPDPDAFRREKLPLPQGAYESSPFEGRSGATAAAVAADARARGQKLVHILTGANHGEELPWLLAPQEMSSGGP